MHRCDLRLVLDLLQNPNDWFSNQNSIAAVSFANACLIAAHALPLFRASPSVTRMEVA